MKQINFHSTPEEIQAHKTEQTTEAVVNSHETLKDLHETAKGHATSKDVEGVNEHLKGLSEITAKNNPQTVVEKLDEVKSETVDTNSKLDTLEAQAKETADLLKKISKQLGQKSLPVELIGMEQVYIQGNDGDKGEKGDNGKDGKDGADGKDGVNGKDGAKGDTGERGPVGPQGLRGERGFKGDKGDSIRGRDGIDGKDGSPDTVEDISKKINSKFNHLDFRSLTNVPNFALAKDIPYSGGGGGGGVAPLIQRDSTGAQISAYVTDIQYGSGLTATYANGKITLTSSGGGAGLTVGTTTITSGTTGRILYDNAGVLGEMTTSGTGTVVVLTNTPTITTPVLTGLPTGTGVASAATVSTLASRDTNGNSTFNNVLESYTTTATAAGTTTLTVASTFQQFFTGVTTQTVQLPAGSTLVLGQQYFIVNNSTGVVTINTSTPSLVVALASNTAALLTCTNVSGAGGWDYQYYITPNAAITLTNKRVTKRTGTTTSSTTPTINTDNVEFYSLTAQTADITSFTTNLSGTPTENQTLWIAITGTAARAITWGSSFEASTVALPTTTVTTARLDVGFVWNTVTSKWRCVASC